MGRVYADWLRRIRDERGWSQRELARRSGVSQGQISRLESGQDDPGEATVEALCRALGAPRAEAKAAAAAADEEAARFLSLYYRLTIDQRMRILAVIEEMIDLARDDEGT